MSNSLSNQIKLFRNKIIEYGTYIELDLFVESNFDKINDDTNIDYFDDYAHLRRIFDKLIKRTYTNSMV